MEKIEGLIISKLTFSPKKLGDLLYYDGPLLSHFIDEERPNDNYLYRWVDNDDDANRWLISKISIEELTDFFEGKLSLKNLLESNQTIILLDLDDELNKKQIILTTLSNVPNSYLPSLSSQFEARFYHKYALHLKDKLIQNRLNDKITSELLDKVNSLEKQQRLLFSTLSEFLEIKKYEEE